MGTRHLTCVVKDGDYKIAQYGQWDGYYDGAGVSILISLLENGTDILRQNVDKAKFVSDEYVDQLFKEMDIEIDGGLVSYEDGQRFAEKYPLLHRDIGYGIIEYLSTEVKEEVLTSSSLDFAQDSLFCEYAYVIDLDKMTFEVFEGFNSEPLDQSERFFSIGDDDNSGGYYPVKFVKSFSLDDLPSIDEFLIALKDE